VLRHLPNLLSLARLAASPVIAWLIVANSQASLMAAFAIYVIGAVTDLLDGRLARLLHAETILGTHLDPLADKAIVLAALAGLAVSGQLSFVAGIAAAIIGLREFGVGALRWILLRAERPLPSDAWAKLKNLLQTVGAGGLLGAASFEQISEFSRQMVAPAEIALGLAFLTGLLSVPSYIRAWRRSARP
jgi:CDP-diacylglycerol--glycerol-3-phosphate 3-phosphatidyltransferase